MREKKNAKIASFQAVSNAVVEISQNVMIGGVRCSSLG
jgi:hypothetical protein